MGHNHIGTTVAALATGAFISGSAFAAGWADRTMLSGFFSAAYSQTDNAAFFHGDRETGVNEDGSFQGTRLGLNIRSEVSDRLTVVTQMSSFFEEDSYSTHLDWAFASFDLGPSSTLRAGKIKYPVGIVNEYIDVGVAYPWIRAPLVIYSEEAIGPQSTREAYTGASLLWNATTGRWEIGTDLFWGQVNLDQMQIKGMAGLTLRGTWNELVQLQGSYYAGKMKTDPEQRLAGQPGSMWAMHDQTHEATLAGIKLDGDRIVAYAEYADVDMDSMVPAMAKDMDSESWYTTLGYRFGQWLPHVTFQDWERGNGYGHEIASLGLNYALSHRTVIKLEASRIDSGDMLACEDAFWTMTGGEVGTTCNDPGASSEGREVVGLFDVADTGGVLSDDSVNLYSVAVDVIF